MSEITRVLSSIQDGNPEAAAELLPLVYDNLRNLAARKLAHEKPGNTLQATALVHEAYLRLVDTENVQDWDSRGHFFSAAAEAMRRILIEAARRRQSQKRGGEFDRIELDEIFPEARIEISDDLLVLDEALSKLADVDSAAAELVKLRFFAGLTVEESAEVLGVSPRTTKRNWAFARAWLQRELERD